MRIWRCSNARQNQQGDEVSLIQNIDMRISCEVSTITVISKRWVKRQVAPRVAAVLDQLVFGDGSHEVASTPDAIRQERLVLLRKKLTAVECRLNHKL